MRVAKTKPVGSANSSKPLSLKKYSYKGRQIELSDEQVFDFTGKVESAYAAQYSGQSDFHVAVVLKDNAKQTLKKFSEQNIKKEAGMIFKGKLLLVAVMQDSISGGKFQITGRYTHDEAKKLASELTGK